MVQAVLEANEVSLNAVRYKITGPVQRTLASVYPGKIVTGDYTKDSSPNLSTLALSDHRGGIGQDIYNGDGSDGPANRSWYSTAETRFKGHLILPPLVTNTPSLPAGLTNIFHLMAFQGGLSANLDATTNGLYNYAVDTGWGANILGNGVLNVSGRYAIVDANDTAVRVYGGSASQYIYGSTLRTVGGGSGLPVGWRNRLWVVSATSPFNLLSTVTPGSAEIVHRSTPMLRALVFTGQLFIGPDTQGEEAMYLAAPTGLFGYDQGNDEWKTTGIRDLPDSPNVNGVVQYVSGLTWRGDIYYAARSSVLRYRPQAGTVEPIGPDRDDGLPSDKGYIIQDMVASVNEVIISLRGGATESRKSLILAWDGRSWRVLYESATNDEELRPLCVVRHSTGVEPTAYRLYFANNTTSPFNIAWLPLQSDLVNPLRVSTYTYAAAATHDWPWFTAGQDDVTKVAVRVKVQTTNPTTAETVKVYYALNRSATFQIMTNSTYTNGTITAAGIQTFDFPSVDAWVSTTALSGTAFRSIQFRVVFARGGTNTNTPDMLSLTLEYYKKLDPKWQFQVEIDANGDYKGRTPKELRAALLTAQETATRLEFTYRDPDANTDATFYVQARPLVGAEQTGLDERGTLGLMLVEV